MQSSRHLNARMQVLKLCEAAFRDASCEVIPCSGNGLNDDGDVALVCSRKIPCTFYFFSFGLYFHLQAVNDD